MRRYGSMKKQLALLILFVLVVIYSPGLLDYSLDTQTIVTMIFVVSVIVSVFLYLKNK